MARIRLDKMGPVAVLTLTRSEARNAVDLSMMEEIRQALIEIEADNRLRVGVLTGEGPVFCAGMDLAAFIAGDNPGLTEPDGFAGFATAARTKPFIAAVNGPALAGGFELMLACEIAIAVPEARFGLPEVQLGLFPAGGGAVRLPHRLPKAIAAEMLLTGDPIGADRALALGLINRVEPAAELMDATLALAGRIAGASPGAVRACMEIMGTGTAQAESTSWQQSDRLWPVVSTSDDAREGPQAFLEKRPPVFQ